MVKAQTPREGIKNISLKMKRGAFSTLLHFFSKEALFGEVAQVRALLSNERAKIVHTIKQNNPESIYSLAKMLGRDFQSVRKDISLLQHFGVISLRKQGKGRTSLKPVLNLDTLQININF
jgi:predicted transcriptional regulator